MPNLKQRLIKAGTDFNYSEGVKVKAGEAIATNEIVYASGYDGPFIEVSLADAGVATKRNGRLMIAKHAIPSGEYGVVLPWKLVTGINTSAASNGDKVFLSDATPGGYKLTTEAGSGDASILIGSVVSSHLTTGGILLCTDMGKT